MGLVHALDKDVLAAVERFREDGIAPQVHTLYTAIQKSNSSLKRRPKKVLEASLERVLEFLDLESGEVDSEAALETVVEPAVDGNSMNRGLRANLAPPTVPVSDTVPRSRGTKRSRNGEPRQEALPTMALDDLGGMEEIFENLEDLAMSLLVPEDYHESGLAIPRGILLHGPPGCGKTTIARTFASAVRLPLVQILGPSIVSGMSGESEKGVREKFDEAKRLAPCILFIDEIDAIAPKRETSQAGMEKRIVAQLLVCMDELGADPLKPVIVLAATNRPDALDSALRRGGRFDTEIMIGVPNEETRASILEALTTKVNLAQDVDFKAVAKRTAGFVGADLKDLVTKAGAWQMRSRKRAYKRQAVADDEMDTGIRKPHVVELERLITRLERKDLAKPQGEDGGAITMRAFESVLPTIIPSSKREGFATIPDVSWQDVGALQQVREELDMAVVQPIINPERFRAVGLDAPSGVLLWGPPGCGKTLLAKAVAAESKANFISIKGPELLDKFVGESEAAVRRVFSRARSSAPCIIFFDELDALAPRRDGSAAESTARVVNMLLTELDGLSDRTGIFVIGATNRPDIIDEAMLRPGRLETRLFVDLPGPQERVEILQTLLRRKGVDRNLAQIAASEACDGFTGADLGHLWSRAAQHALKRGANAVVEADLAYAVSTVEKSVQSMDKYLRLKKRFANQV